MIGYRVGYSASHLACRHEEIYGSSGQGEVTIWYSMAAWHGIGESWSGVVWRSANSVARYCLRIISESRYLDKSLADAEGNAGHGCQVLCGVFCMV